MNNWKLRHSFTGNATSDVQTVNGYLADPAYHLTTNLLLQSNQFDTTWGSFNTAVTSGESGYDGSLDAWLLEADAVGSSATISQSVSIDGVMTASIYAKEGTTNWFRFSINDSGVNSRAWFDLSGSGAVGTTAGTIIDAKIESAGNGYFRCSITFNATAGNLFVFLANADNTTSYSVGDNIYIQDAQLEQGTQATTYVETTTDPVTLPDTFNVTVVPDGKEYAAPLFIPRTNLLPYSEDFNSWTLQSSVTITDNATTSPTGSGDASKYNISATTQRALDQSVVLNDSSTYTFSMWVKAIVDTTLRVRSDASDWSEDIDLLVSDGWKRITSTHTMTLTEYEFGFFDVSGSTGDRFYIYGAQLEEGDTATAYIPTNGSPVTRDWSAFGRVQNQLPGISNGTHTHTGAASGSGIAATTITGSGSGATFAYDFDTLGVLTTLTADDAGSGYKVGDKLSIDTTEGHTIEFRLVEGSNAATVSVSMGAAKPNKPIPFPVSKMRVEGLTDRTVLFLDKRSQYVFPKPTPYLLDTYEGAAAAYSLRRLRSAYTGPAVRVRRASNNDELDIYFNRDGSLDTATLEAFCAGTDGFVKVWYDQGQEGNDAEQTSTASQPQIVSSGSVVTDNGKPALEFVPYDNFPFDNSALDIGSLSSFTVGRYANTSDNQIMLGLSGGVANKRWFTPYLTGGNFNYAYGAQATYMNTPADTNQNLHTLIAGSTLGGIEAFLNSSSVGTQATLVSGIDLTNSGIMKLGTAFYTNGNLQEVIVYDSDQSANRQGIEDNINEHYGIYP